jgi:dsDNA-specific endonuclease/ATPase MutS2
MESSIGDDIKKCIEPARQILKLLNEEKYRGLNFDDAVYETEDRINEEIKKIQSRGEGAEQLTQFLEDRLLDLAERLVLDEGDVRVLKNAAFENQAIPFTFSSHKLETLRKRYERRIKREGYLNLKRLAEELENYRFYSDKVIRFVYDLDFYIAVTKFSTDFGLEIPDMTNEIGIGFVDGKNLLLLRDALVERGDAIQTVSYSLGNTDLQIFGATKENVAILTGANSGGKTTLLETLALVHILTLLGLPVPAKKTKIPLVPIYLFRRRTARKVGGLEHAIRILKPILTGRGPKMVLIDEFEALTEPGALGKIIASILNNLPKTTLTLFITHLAKEILPFLKRSIRIDGIEASGIDEKGNLIVNRQPIFNHLGTSTPELIIGKLLKRTKSKRLQKIYKNMVNNLQEGKTIYSK